VGLFGRKKPLHEQLAERGGIAGELDEEREPIDPVPRLLETGIHGISRPRRWDAVVSAEAPELDGDEATFVALPDGSLLVESEVGEASLDPLADALAGAVEPPYRAHAVRQGERLWAVSANRINVAQFAADGDAIELTSNAGERALVVDGARIFGSIPELERLGARGGANYAIRAARLDGDLWEVQVSPL
jgi:hypothetical protein